jgi:hypothetical protein
MWQEEDTNKGKNKSYVGTWLQLHPSYEGFSLKSIMNDKCCFPWQMRIPLPQKQAP